MSVLLLIGAVVASLANVLGGAVGDLWLKRTGSRRGLIAIGLAGVIASYAGFAVAGSVAALLLALVTFQVAFNLLYAPLGALLADFIDDADKGFTAGLSGMALPLATFSIPLFAMTMRAGYPFAFATLGLVVVLTITPLLVFWPRLPMVRRIATLTASSKTPRTVWPDFIWAWNGRLLIQCGGATMVGYLYFFLRYLVMPRGASVDTIAAYLSVLAITAALAGLGTGIVAGRLSDKFRMRRASLVAGSVVVAAGLATLALGPPFPVVVVAYAAFSAGLAGFLAIDSALVAQLLSGHPKRGLALGVMNLSNTLPAIGIPALTLMMAQTDPGQVLLRTMITGSAIAAILAGGAVLNIRSVR